MKNEKKKGGGQSEYPSISVVIDSMSISVVVVIHSMSFILLKRRRKIKGKTKRENRK